MDHTSDLNRGLLDFSLLQIPIRRLLGGAFWMDAGAKADRCDSSANLDDNRFFRDTEARRRLWTK